MLVTIAVPLTVSQSTDLGRFGQLALSAQGRLESPTNRLRPGKEALAMAQANQGRSVVLDDGADRQNPNPTPYLGPDRTVRAGDVVTQLTGVIDYGPVGGFRQGWRLQPTVVPKIERVNVRTHRPPAVGGDIRIASVNLHNFFTTFSDGSHAPGKPDGGCTRGSSTANSECRGAANAREFERQLAKTTAMLAALDVDVIGLMEVQNDGQASIGKLVSALNARLKGAVYASTAEPAQGSGSDAIRVAMIYKRRTLHAVGNPVSVRGSGGRQPLAQAFAAGHSKPFVVVVNHWKSKLCSDAAGADADQGDLQGCYNATRIKQAQSLHRFVEDVKRQAKTDDVLLVGDFNAYVQEDPLVELAKNGYVDAFARHDGESMSYSSTFEGAAGRIDHAFASKSLAAKLARAGIWHINADEPEFLDYRLSYKQPACGPCEPDLFSPTPYRASDHDPILVGLMLSRSTTAKR